MTAGGEEMGSNGQAHQQHDLDEDKETDGVGDHSAGEAPKDKYYLVYIIMMIHGVGILLPWNMFINAASYFTDYKLSPGFNETESDYRKNFLEYVGVAGLPPCVILHFLNIFFQVGGSSRIRIVYAICTTLSMFILTITLAMVDSSQWQTLFFFITLSTLIVAQAGTGIYQNSIHGVAAYLPMEYNNAVVTGYNVSGTFVAVLSIITHLSSPNLRTSAIWYFTGTVFILLICLDTYFALPLLKFFTHYEDRTSRLLKESTVERTTSRPPYLAIFKRILPQCFNVWCVYFVSFACFPAIQYQIDPVDNTSPLVNSGLFALVTCFLFFNGFSLIGNIIPSFIRFPGPRWVFIPVIIRVVFIPLLMMCNYRVQYRSIPVYIENDYVYMALAILMALSSGYYSSLVMMYTPGLVESKYASTAAQIAAFFLVLGIFSGVTFSRALSSLIESI